MIDYIVGIGIAAAVIAIVIKGIRNLKKGESGCGCGCSGCSDTACGQNKNNQIS